MSQLLYYIGNALEPVKKPSVIFHCCNTIGRWGAGFVIPLGKKYPLAEQRYRNWFSNVHMLGKDELPGLGMIQLVRVADDVVVANMIAQEGTKPKDGVPPIRYGALEECLRKVSFWAKNAGYTLHGPRLGSSLAGGDWSKVAKIIEKTVSVDTFIYTLPNEKNKWPTVYENA